MIRRGVPEWADIGHALVEVRLLIGDFAHRAHFESVPVDEWQRLLTHLDELVRMVRRQIDAERTV
ncbi:hypothetical protein EV193_101536 [Herbihabitans rhizosphaerae]|uniref:Uncharacterized protein n=1 Tax=Herbihabitans rhizosphaerae TaxID=1872711 RepID=A0A4Q7L712_9PSEU|nr:hypothetical protein [Herbihabitans rhizosphaerae]RZS44660.1 hypothetical protein EV193_101536 [Herbihabitans rhizosphaerae]